MLSNLSSGTHDNLDLLCVQEIAKSTYGPQLDVCQCRFQWKVKLSAVTSTSNHQLLISLFSTFILVQALLCEGLAVFLELLKTRWFLPFEKTFEMRQQTQ